MSRKRKKKQSPLAVILLILIALLALAMIGAGVYLVFFKNRDAFERQNEERDLANEYIDDLMMQLDDPEEYARKMDERKKKREELERQRESLEAESSGELSTEDYETETEVETEYETMFETEYETDEAGNLTVVPVKTIIKYRTLRSVRLYRDPSGKLSERVGTGYEPYGETERETEYETEFYTDENGEQKVRRVKLVTITKRLRPVLVSRMKKSSPYPYTYEDYTDDNYYSRDGIVYTPDYARGYLDCVLEVPTAGIKRGVYAGTWDDINYNLYIWMVTTARPDYVLGETRYCIYGHNHTVQDLSFNKLQKVQEGEYFYLTSSSGRYTYKITKVFAVTREDARIQYVNNDSIGSDKCYLITCGRNDGVRQFRYLDLMVEGTLVEHLSIAEYREKLKK